MQTAAEIDRMVERAQRNELNRFLGKEAAEERHAEEIEQRAKDMMQVGEEYHPWTFANFDEAIGNAPDAERMVMFATIAAAVDLDLKNEYSNHMALVAIRQLNERYWMEAATRAAESCAHES